MKGIDAGIQIDLAEQHIQALDKLICGLPPEEWKKIATKIGVRNPDAELNGAMTQLKEYRDALKRARDKAEIDWP